ncbi:peroxiredoxin family protein [Trichloromonas sp.]|uniref:peroxiredoxin family protein n=1 Tax=Trichloromonas sp. TaxID=3069249 RepID=UPI003D8166DD
MLKPRLCHLFLICLLALGGALTAYADPIDIGEAFPEKALPAPTDPQQRAYLGLGDGPTFTLSQIGGKVVLVEMLNALCPHCRKQTGPYNKLYRMLEESPETRGKVKMLGVAVANSDEQIADFIDIYQVAFPIVADRRFTLHRAVRGGPTPLSIYALRSQPGEPWVVAGSHLGEDYDMEGLFDFLRGLLQEEASTFASLPSEAVPAEKRPEPPQDEAEISRRVAAAFIAQGGELRDFKRLSLPSGRRVYAATLTRDGSDRTLYAEVASRSSICDICHDVHFFYLFDRSGKVLGLEKLQLTKYGNVEWDAGELAAFVRNVLGRPLYGSWSFNPKVDAVTSATMTSAIIFDSLDQGKVLLEELAAERLLK